MKIVANCVCPVCKKIFAVTYQPEQDANFGEQPVVCPACNTEFLSEHIRHLCDTFMNMDHGSALQILSVYQL